MDAHAQTLIQLFLTARRNEGLAPETLNWYRKRITAFFEVTKTQPQGITPATLREYLEPMKVKESTRAGHFRALRAFIRWAHENGYLGQNNPLAGFKMRFADDPIQVPPPVEWMIRVIDRIPKTPLVNHRDRALFRMIYHTGARPGEIVRLRRQDINLSEGWAQLYGRKTRRHRIVPLVKPVILELTGWLGHLQGDWIFPRFDPVGSWAGGQHNAGLSIGRGKAHRLSDSKPLSTNAVNVRWHIQQDAQGIGRAEQIDVKMLRHGFGTHSRDAGIELIDLMQAMGHSNVQTTYRYVRSGTRAMVRRFNEIWADGGLQGE